jgi:hypothetical protein
MGGTWVGRYSRSRFDPACSIAELNAQSRHSDRCPTGQTRAPPPPLSIEEVVGATGFERLPEGLLFATVEDMQNQEPESDVGQAIWDWITSAWPDPRQADGKEDRTAPESPDKSPLVSYPDVPSNAP